MKTVVIIPSRYGSTRFEGKPLCLINEKPMIQHVYEQAQKASKVDAVLVATDDQRIIDAVAAFGGKAVMTSDKNRSGTDRIAEAAAMIGLEPNDIVINVQGDQPLMDPRCLDQLVAPFYDEPGLEMSTLAFKIVREREITDPKDVKVTFDNRGYALYFSRASIPLARDPGTRHDTFKHLGFYAYTRKFLDIYRHLDEGSLEAVEKLEQLRALEHGYRIKVVVTLYDSPEVDLPEDIPRIEKLMQYSDLKTEG
jgi:3-deoxy-manno-octulosonate cytidylyltransferase (CMP-KDO synthetase)